MIEPAANTGDGRPSYWAAPMTTMASAVVARRGPCPRSGRGVAVARRAASRRRRDAGDASAPPPLSGRGTSCTWRPSRTSTGRCARSARRSACSPAARRRRPRRRATARRRRRDRLVAERLADVADRRARPARRRAATAEPAPAAAVVAGRGPAAAAAGPDVAPAPLPSPAAAARSAAAPAASACDRPASGGGWRWTVTRKIDEATPWRMRPRSSSYSRNASRRNSLSGSCWA